MLPCCQTRGCWKRRVQKIGDGRRDYDKSLCKQPHREDGRDRVPKCMDMIQTDHVTEALMSYYEDGTLKPISETTGKYQQPPTAATPLPTQTPRKPVERGEVYGRPPIRPIGEPAIIRPTERIATGQADPPGAKPPAIPATPQDRPVGADLSVPRAFDSPAIGGKVTICMLMFGEDHSLHRRLFTSVCRTVPNTRVELRVACNQVSLDTTNMLNTFPLRKVYQDNGRRRKAGAMRDIFYDEDDPIDTNWIVWLDDTAFAKDPGWLSCLVETIANQKAESKVGLVGLKVRYAMQNHRGQDPRDWFARAPWFTGKNFRNKLGRDAPNGDQIHLVHSNFFAISRKLTQAAVIPDKRIEQSGSAICLGEQAHQLGFRTKQFNEGYRYVQVTHTQAKRGLHEKYPWE